MGRMYVATFTNVAVTAQQDFFEIVAPADSAVVIHYCNISQSSDYGDANDEGLRVNIKRGQTTSGSGGGAFTPLPLAAGDAAFGGTVEINNTTIAADGTIVVLHAEAFNIRAGWNYMPTPECRIVISPGIRATIGLITTPADSLTMEGTLIFEEIGG
jgi:hypothetical protein